MKNLAIIIIGISLLLISLGAVIISNENESDISIQAEKGHSVVLTETNDLMGIWFTPHAALRRIKIFNPNRFIFDEWEGEPYEGNFSFDGETAILKFDSQDKEDLLLNYESDDYSEYLKDLEGGEYFVKSSGIF